MDLVKSYHDWLSATIDEEGVSMPTGLVLHQDNTMTVIALAVTPDQGYTVMLKQWALMRPKEIIFAFDRFAKPGQGTTLGDLVAGHHFVSGQPSRSFIVEYQHDPRILLPINWDNLFWNDALLQELRGTIRNLGLVH